MEEGKEKYRNDDERRDYEGEYRRRGDDMGE